jgi:hypothetical protein
MNPTPEQVAALAEAMGVNGIAVENVSSIGNAEQWLPDTQLATAILAALPDDWCGHIVDLQQAEIARLRKIEEVLSAPDLWLGVELIALNDIKFPEPMISVSGARAAIRAALTGETP